MVLGHGPVAEHIADLAHRMGFPVAVADPQATPEAFPHAEDVLVDDPDYTHVPVTPESFVVVATEHESDGAALAAAVEKAPRYLALVASRRTADRVLGGLLDAGVPRERLAAVRTPAGLDLGADGPAEIALAVVGEIVAVKRGGSGRPLVEVKGHRLREEFGSADG